jgi:hypothetical protein
MMADEFNPDAFLQKYAPPDAGGGGFDPNAFLQKYDAPTAAPQRNYELSEIPGAALKNAPHSAMEFGKNLVQPFIHPIDTAVAMKNLGLGVGEKVSTMLGKKLGVAGPGEHEKYADAVGQHFADKYGGWENIKRSVAEDPVGTLADTSAVLTGGGGLAARAPGLIGKIGEAAQTAGRYTDPINAAVQTAKLPGKILSAPPAKAEPMRQIARNTLDKEGIEYTAGQLSGKQPDKYREAMSGVPAEMKRLTQLEQLTQAVSRRIGENSTDIHEAVQQARPKIVNQLETATRNMVVHADPQFFKDITNIERDAIKRGHAPDSPIVREIAAMRDNVLGAFDINTFGKAGKTRFEMPGQNFHEQIRKDSHIADSVKTPGPIGMAARKLQKALFDAAERTAKGQGTQKGKGRDLALTNFRDARHKYANLVAIEDVASSAGADIANGLLTPAHVRQLATSQQKSDYARGRGDFHKLARATNTLLAPLPNSGTTQRALAAAPARLAGAVIGGTLGGGTTGLLGGGAGAAAGMAFGPWAQGRVVMSKPMQELAKRRWEQGQTKSATWSPQPTRQIARPLGNVAYRAGQAKEEIERKRRSNPYAP